nr:CynX/NimT family MFS transporter [uncultured Ralstonia sp.]
MSETAAQGAVAGAPSTTPIASARIDAGWIGVAVVIALGLNLRPILTTIGPLLAEIRAGTGLGLQGASLLTVIPVLCMGSVALFLPWLARWVPEHRGVACSLLAIAGACVWRLWAGHGTALIASAALAGTGVAIVQALVPGIVKRWFPQRVPMALGLYSASLMAGGGIAATLSPRITHMADWHVGLGVWALPALAALVLWATARPREAAAPLQCGPVLNFFGNRRAWLLAIYFGAANGGYTSMIAWLPMFYRRLGWSAQDAGSLIGVMTIFQVTGALAAPLLARRWPDRRPWLMVVLVLQFMGMAGLLLAPQTGATLWIALIGGGLGSMFSLCLTLTLDHLPDARAAGYLAAFVQGIGFIITGIIPYAVGWLREVTGGFQMPWLLLMTIVIASMATTLRFAPSGYARAIGQV